MVSQNWVAIEADLSCRPSHTVIKFMDVYQRSYCRPIETLVDIFQEYPDEIEYIFKPSCVPLMRCAGCCNDEALECVPTSENNITMQVGTCGTGDRAGGRRTGGTGSGTRRLSGPLPGKLLVGVAKLGLRVRRWGWGFFSTFGKKMPAYALYSPAEALHDLTICFRDLCSLGSTGGCCLQQVFFSFSGRTQMFPPTPTRGFYLGGWRRGTGLCRVKSQSRGVAT